MPTKSSELKYACNTLKSKLKQYFLQRVLDKADRQAVQQNKLELTPFHTIASASNVVETA